MDNQFRNTIPLTGDVSIFSLTLLLASIPGFLFIVYIPVYFRFYFRRKLNMAHDNVNPREGLYQSLLDSMDSSELSHRAKREAATSEGLVPGSAVAQPQRILSPRSSFSSQAMSQRHHFSSSPPQSPSSSPQNEFTTLSQPPMPVSEEPRPHRDTERELHLPETSRQRQLREERTTLKAEILCLASTLETAHANEMDELYRKIQVRKNRAVSIGKHIVSLQKSEFSSATRRMKRSHAAHQNGLEVFPAWSVAALIAFMIQLSENQTVPITCAFLGIRFLYNFVYIFGNTKPIAAVRSTLFQLGMICIYYLMIGSIIRFVLKFELSNGVPFDVRDPVYEEDGIVR